MIAEGKVAPDRVEYNDLPWKYAAGTPNILGVIVSAQALRLLAGPGRDRTRPHAGSARRRRSRHRSSRRRWVASAGTPPSSPTWRCAKRCRSTDSPATGRPPALPRSPLLAFNVAGVDPFALAEALGREGVEARAGCHCATLAHRDLGLNPPASCRLSFALYNSRDDVHPRHGRRTPGDRPTTCAVNGLPDTVAVFGLAGGALGAAESLPYVRDTLRRTTVPHRGSWLIWGVIEVVAVEAQRAHGTGWSVVPPGCPGDRFLLGVRALHPTRERGVQQSGAGPDASLPVRGLRDGSSSTSRSSPRPASSPRTSLPP